MRRRSSLNLPMEVRRGRTESGGSPRLPMPPRGEVARRNAADGNMGDRPTDVHPAAGILGQRGGLGALGVRPAYPEAAQYIDPSGTSRDFRPY